MKVTAYRVNSIKPVIFGAHAAFEIDFDESSTEDVFRAMWETYGDEFVFGLLDSEGYAVVPKPNTPINDKHNQAPDRGGKETI